MAGWIKLHRDMMDHWIWEDDQKLKWWLIILLNVNHETKKMPVGNKLIDCEPGQSMRSIDTWTGLFKCSKKTTIKFFRLLENQQMISCKTAGNGNRRKHLLTVTNWTIYQEKETGVGASTTPETPPKGNPNVPPNKNVKNEEEVSKADFLSKIVAAFQESYFEIFQSEYTVVAIGKERSAAAKIAKIYKDKYPQAKTEEVIAALKNYFLACCGVQDEWMQKNMSLPIIISKFNEINNTIKNKPNGKKPTNRSVAERSGEIDAIVDAVFEAREAAGR